MIKGEFPGRLCWLFWDVCLLPLFWRRSSTHGRFVHLSIPRLLGFVGMPRSSSSSSSSSVSVAPQMDQGEVMKRIWFA